MGLRGSHYLPGVTIQDHLSIHLYRMFLFLIIVVFKKVYYKPFFIYNNKFLFQKSNVNRKIIAVLLWLYIFACVYVLVSVDIHTCGCMWVWWYVWVFIYRCMCDYGYICVYIYIYISVSILAHIDMYEYIFGISRSALIFATD